MQLMSIEVSKTNKNKIFNIRPEERYVVCIDGANVYATLKLLQFDFDYKNLASLFHDIGKLLRIKYYTALNEYSDFSPLRPLVDWLEYNGYDVVSKPLKEYTDDNGVRKIKSELNVEICVDMIKLIPHVDHYVLFSGDGNFSYLIKHLQAEGKRVTVVSSLKSRTQMISDELRRQADFFVDMSVFSDICGRQIEQHENSNVHFEDNINEDMLKDY